MSRNDARPAGEETISQAEEQPERNPESNEAVQGKSESQGESCGTDLDTDDNWVQREVEPREDSER